MRKVKATPDEVEDVLEMPVEEDPLPVEAPEPSKEQEHGIDEVFPPEYVEPLRGLMFLGFIENEVEYGGHRFLIGTLREGEILRIGQLLKNFAGTVTEIEARRMYTVAASVRSVDGIPLCPPYKDGTDAIYEKSLEVRKWYPAVIRFLYNEYAAMETTAINVSDALKK